ncbi:hypothetical protein PI23P_06266 [Polaribacter irgensii 23-P]|uniref:Uncharacterized protein n=1 Tax=Polaribacter irgensii 23-P TaxID=313594 RepID=A4C352_9FLAO|nr:hypothetical protein [Polaribacter irgensii]EAR11523.1 hypothetical protein PI23P_06266 [Polaribacter irgensii 23-P]
MDNVFKYYEFSDFFMDTSGMFFNNEISYSSLNDTHFLIFEKKEATYNLYVSKYNNNKEIGVHPAIILELLVTDYDKGNPAHRIAIKQYLD